MKGLFYIFAAIIVCSMATDDGFPSKLCSLRANGTARVTYNERVATLYVTMIRMNDYARYDVYNDPKYNGLNHSCIARPDLGKAYCYYPFIVSTMCRVDNSIYFNLRNCEYQKTINGLDEYSKNARYTLSFNHSTGFISGEDYAIRFNEYYGETSHVEVTYTSWDYDYNSEDSTTFILEYDLCPSVSKTEPVYAKTSLQCSEIKTVKSKLPGCSFEFQVTAEGIFNKSIKIMYSNDTLFYLYSVEGNDTYLLRSDITDAHGKIYYLTHNASGYCREGYRINTFEDPEWYLFGGFDYRREPKNVTCPDNSTGCLMYCNYDPIINTCCVFKDGFLVAVNETVFTYKTTVPTIEDFEAVDCNGTAIAIPEDLCFQPPSSSSDSSALSSSSSDSSALSSSSSDSSVLSSSFSGSSALFSSSGTPTAPSSAAPVIPSQISSAPLSIPSIVIAVIAMLFAALF